MKENFGDILKKIREEKGFSLRQLGIKTGISHSYISEIEKNRFFKRETIEKLIKALEIGKEERDLILKKLDYSNTPDEVLKELERLKKERKQPELPIEPRRIESNIDLNCSYKQIPLYSSISAGLGLEELDSDEIEFISVPNIKQFSGDLVAIRVSGDSMEFTIENGSIVFVKKDVEVPNKKVGAFIHNNKALLKRYLIIEGKTFLRSDNRDYPDIIVDKDDEFKIVGRVVAQIEEID